MPPLYKNALQRSKKKKVAQNNQLLLKAINQGAQAITAVSFNLTNAGQFFWS